MDKREKDQCTKLEKETDSMDKQLPSLGYIGQIIRVLAEVTEGLWTQGKADYLVSLSGWRSQ